MRVLRRAAGTSEGKGNGEQKEQVARGRKQAEMTEVEEGKTQCFCHHLFNRK
jgi:hypothetical protein